jgi:hypothetical protein
MMLRVWLPTLHTQETLRTTFRDAIREKTMDMTSVEQLRAALDRLYESYRRDAEETGDEVVPCVVASDAATMDFSKTGAPSIFAVSVNPLNKEMRPRLWACSRGRVGAQTALSRGTSAV